LSSLAAILAFGATALLAWFTYRLALETRRLAGDSEEDMRSNWRPVILAASALWCEVVSSDDGIALITKIRLTNEGRGPAFNVRTSMSVVGRSERLGHALGTMKVGRIARSKSGFIVYPPRAEPPVNEDIARALQGFEALLVDRP
jgi:hypothetical protein